MYLTQKSVEVSLIINVILSHYFFLKCETVISFVLWHRGKGMMVDLKVELTSLVTHVMHFGKNNNTL